MSNENTAGYSSGANFFRDTAISYGTDEALGICGRYLGTQLIMEQPKDEVQFCREVFTAMYETTAEKADPAKLVYPYDFQKANDRTEASYYHESRKRNDECAHGHAAVLFTSYNTMGQVFAMLRERNLPYPMFQMGRRDTAALEKFKANDNGILFASGALWEGIDIPGDSLSMLIIVKLPFAVPDPIGDYERTLYPDMDAYKTQALVPDMLVKLKQGFGRLIRTENDSGVCAILDSRVREGYAYHDRMMDVLPSCQIASNLEDIRQFMIDRKPPAYFA